VAVCARVKDEGDGPHMRDGGTLGCVSNWLDSGI